MNEVLLVGSIVRYSVSISFDGSVCVIGSRGSDVVANNGGSAYIFS